MIKVHGVPLSPFVRKVLLVLDYKGIEFENIPVFPGSDEPEFRAISPLGKIPVLEHDGFTIPDTSVICRYLDKVFPENSVYPTDPKEEATACWLEEFGDSKLIDACATIFRQRFLNPTMFDTPTDEDLVKNAIEEELPPLLAYLESVTPESGVLVGTNVSIADIAIITCFAQAQYGEYEVDGTSYPKLRAYIDRSFSNSVLTDRLESEKEMFANR